MRIVDLRKQYIRYGKEKLAQRYQEIYMERLFLLGRYRRLLKNTRYITILKEQRLSERKESDLRKRKELQN